MLDTRGAHVHRSLTALRGRPVLVAGAGVSGLAVAAALVDLGAVVTVTDGRADRLTELPEGAQAQIGLDTPPPGTELVVTSPGWRPDAPLLKASVDAGIEVIGEPELAWRWPVPAGSAPRWLAVTGTNGKTTTVGMLESILVTSGRDAIACGNVGTPVIDAVRAGHRELAVELSSFQLYWSPSLRPAAGCLLNIAEDHLDWHGGMDGYVAAKAGVLTGPVAVAGADDPLAAGALAASPAERKIGVTLGVPNRGQFGVLDGTLVDNEFGEGIVELLGIDELPLTGPPAQLDAMAAAALARSAGLTADEVVAGLRAFRPGPHRGSVVATVDGVRFVDDSKATNPHAADAALSGHRRVVWIAGGQLKGASVTELIHQHAHRLVGVVLMGTDRAMFGDALLRHAPDVPVQEVRSGEHDPMTDAVRRAAAMAAPGDVVLLAPAAASLDQFTGYAARGLAFADAASGLRKSGSGTPSGTR